MGSVSGKVHPQTRGSPGVCARIDDHGALVKSGPVVKGEGIVEADIVILLNMKLVI